MEDKYQTLGDNVVPVNYYLTFDTNLKTFKFNGNEIIRVKVAKKARSISLNAVDIGVLSATVISKGIAQAARVSEDKKRNEIRLAFKDAISGDAEIAIKFIGINNDKMNGFYRSRYMDKGKQKYMLSSQFEAADARSAFPCFDEPSFKATYDVSMIVDNELEAVSNMPVSSVKPAGKGRKIVTFQTTPRMSSYLLYLGAGRFDSVETNLGRIKLRVMATPGKKNLCKLPLSYAKKFTKYFQEYFGVKFPLPKIDFLAIPDFSAGAMENWGAITFREVAILGDEKATPIAVQQQIAETVAHELAHQWFGDLVTMKWWNDLWLNESFATFMANKAMDAVFPEWKMSAQYFDDVIATAFSADSLKSTHPISVKVSTPEEIDQIFDAISYEKGGTVLHMLENYAGKEGFRKGLHLYLTKNAYSNATKYDLWGSVDKAVGKKGGISVTNFASSWINNTGYPIVEVSEGSGKLKARQKRFLLVDYKLDKNEKWPIPIPYLTEGGKQGKEILSGDSVNLPIKAASWAKLNYGQHYLYRVRYPDAMLGKLGQMIKSGKLKGPDSWGIENDLFILARSGRITANKYLDFVERYCMDPDYPLSFNVSSHLSWLKNVLEDGKTAKRVRSVSIKYHKKVLKRLGWVRKKNEDSIETMFRSIAISSLGNLEDKETVAKAVSMFNSYVKGGKLDPNLKGALYGIVAWVGDAKRYDQMVKLYRKEQIPDDKRRYLQSLAAFRTKSLVERTFKYAFSKDVRLQDSYALPALLSSNPIGKKMIWGWTRKNWKMLLNKYDSGTHMLERFAVNLGVISTIKEKDEIAKFFSIPKNKRGDINLRVKQSLEKIDANINFLKANKEPSPKGRDI